MKKPRVFFSYAHDDRADQALAQSLAKDMVAAGFRVWTEGEVLAGDNWAKEVGKALETSNAMVVIVSPSSAKSEWVKREVEFALGSERYAKRLIPVVVRATTEMPWILNRLRSVRVTGDRSAVSQKVIEALDQNGAE